MESRAQSKGTSRGVDRRSFLRISGLLGLGIVSSSMFPTKAEAVRFNRKTYKVSRMRLAMGTFVSMTVIHPSRDQAQEAIGRAFEEINRLTLLMSRFDSKTAVAQLNREGSLRDLPPALTQVVQRALEYYRLTGGAFDISVKPVVDLFREKFGQGQKARPSQEEIRGVLSLVGADMIHLQGSSIRFEKPGMGITLDGIAKGYIVDRASSVLEMHHVENHLINAGGDIRTRGSKRDHKPWTVAIQDPQKRGHYPDIVHMTDGAIATSGNYEVYYDREKMFHHIVDPSTGMSPQLSTSVSVISNTTMDADALSTSVFVMGPDRGIRLIESLKKCESYVITKQGQRVKSSGWESVSV